MAEAKYVENRGPLIKGRNEVENREVYRDVYTGSLIVKEMALAGGGLEFIS